MSYFKLKRSENHFAKAPVPEGVSRRAPAPHVWKNRKEGNSIELLKIQNIKKGWAIATPLPARRLWKN